MPILRDLVAKLSLDLDKKSFKDADKALTGLTDRFSGLGGKVALVAAAFGALKLTGFASDAQETMNVLDASFEGNTETVKDWASATADAAGRSEFQLREMASSLGAVLNPMMGRSAKVAADMSTRLSTLAVDLGSFYNRADNEALVALRAALVGEMEPLRRFGVVMHVASLEAFAMAKGIKQSFKEMTIAEKTALRYEFILDQTKLAQGDAARTADFYANSTKAVGAAFRDIATRAGQVLLPIFEKVVHVVRDGARAFAAWAKNSKILQAALIVLGAIATTVFTSIFIAALPVLIPLAKLIALVTVVTLVLNDLLMLFSGSDSVIGSFIDAIFGPGSATSAITNLKLAFEGMVMFWEEVMVPAWKDTFTFLRESITSVGQWFADVFTGIYKGFMRVVKAVWGGIKLIGQAIGKAAKFLGLEFSLGPDTTKAVDDHIAAREKKEQDSEARTAAEERKWDRARLEDRYKRRMARDKKARDKQAEANKTARSTEESKTVSAGKKLGRKLKSMNKKRVRDSKRVAQEAMRYNVNIQFLGARPTVAAPFSSSRGPTTIQQNVAVNVSGSATAGDARSIAETTSASVRSENKKTLAALTQRAGS